MHFLIAILGAFIIPHTALGQTSVRINEIMYAPISPEPEWIELYNPSNADISTKNWKVKVKTKSVILGVGLIPAGGYLVITKDSNALLSAHSNQWFRIAQDTLPTLANSGDVISFSDASGKIVDSLTYFPNWGGKNGKSLERVFINGSSTDSANWGSSIDDSGSTPGFRNSITPPDHDLAVVTDGGFFSGDTISMRITLRNRGTQNASLAKLYLVRSVGEGSVLHTPTFIDSINLPTIVGFDSLEVTFREPNQPYTSLTYEVRVVLDSDEVAKNDTATLRFASGLAPQSVVINEVMYAPKGIEPEWVELYNRTTDTLDLSAALIRNASQSVGSFPDNTLIAPSEYLVVTKSDSMLRVARRRQIASNRIVRMPLPDLLNTGDAISLLDARGTRVDSMVFRPSWGGRSGASLERIDFDQLALDSTNLGNCIDSSEATPGVPNSIRRRGTDMALISVSDSINTDGSLTLILHLQNQGKTRIDTCAITVTSLDSNSTQSLASSMIAPELAALGLDTERISFAPIEYGISHYRVSIHTPRDSILSNDSLVFTDTLSVPVSGLKLNEIMFSPITSSCQWIELYNSTYLPIQTAGLLLRVSSDTAKHLLALPASLIPSSSFVIVAADSSFYNAFPSLANKTTIIQLSRATLELSTIAGSLAVTNPDSSIIEGTTYSPTWLTGTIGGISLERISRRRSAEDSSNWLPSVAQAGATPLAENSVSNLNPSGLLIPVLSITPNPFSPDGDGVDDVTAIQYTTGSTLEVTTRIRICDMRSRTVRTLVDGARTYLQGQASFDGRSDSGNTLPIGLYTLFIECTDDAGITRSARTGIVIAKRVH